GGFLGLRFDPIGGGQFKAAVKAIVEAESQPLKQLEVRKSREEAKLKLFQDFKAKFGGIDKCLQEVSNFRKFRELKVDLGDGSEVATVTVDKERAEPGVYTIQVDQMAARTSVISNAFEDPDAPILGTGFIVMNLPDGGSKEIYVDPSDGSLRKLASTINSDPDSPVRASVIKDAIDSEEPWKLILTAKKEGAINDLQFPDFYFLDGDKDFYIDDSNEAQNAQIMLDGFPIDLESNEVPDFLPGVTMRLKQARPDKPFTLTITEDKQKIAGKVKDLVDKLNGVLGFINQQNQLDEKSDTKNTFGGDTSLQTIEYRLRNLMHEAFPYGNEEKGTFGIVTLGQIGIEFDKGGTLQFKEDKFVKAMEKNYDQVAEAISGSMGFAFQMGTVLAGYTTPQVGTLALREQGFRTRIRDIDKQIENKQRMLDRRQQNLTEQFSRLQSSLSNMQQQQQYLAASMPGAGGGGNLVQQLLGG
ncbi:MAG TPA: flagellar filament capping protein FliD, partial [Bdellovibrionota bacterium]|nr:flagellar filament capping protein FliD [Bdellovibrionota bacterium]